MDWLKEIKRKHDAKKRSRSATPATLSPNTSSLPISQPETASSLDASSAWNIPEKLWNQAYDELKSSEKDITDAYEKILSYGTLIASGSNDRTVKIWDTTLAECIQTFEGHNYRVTSVAFSSTGKRIASGSWDMDVRIWNLESGQCMHVLSGHHKIVHSVAFSPKNPLLASGSRDRTIKIWNIESGYCIKTLKGHAFSVQSVAFSPDGSQLASGSEDNTIKLWDVASWDCTHTLTNHSAGILAVAFSPNGLLLACSSYDKTVKLWNTASGTCEHTIEHNAVVSCVSFSESGLLACSRQFSTDVNILEVPDGKMVQTLSEHSSVSASAVFAPTGYTLAAASEDHTIKLWDIKLHSSSREAGDSENMIESAAFFPDGEYFLSRSAKGAKLCLYASGKCIHIFEGNRNCRTVFSPDGKQLAFTIDNHVQIWDLVLGKIAYTFEESGYRVFAIAFSPDGKHIAPSAREYVNIWDPANGTCQRILQDQPNDVYSLEYSQDGKKLATIFRDNIKIWNVSTDDFILELNTSFRKTAFSPDGKLFAHADSEQIKVWDVMCGKCIHTSPPEVGFIGELIFSSDSKQLVIEGYCYAQIWDLASDTFTLVPELSNGARIISLKNDRLHTNYGYYTIPSRSLDIKSAIGLELVPVGYGFNNDRSWITLNGQNVLWLFPRV